MRKVTKAHRNQFQETINSPLVLDTQDPHSPSNSPHPRATDAASFAVLTPLKLVRATQAVEDGGGGGFFLALDQRIEKTDEGSHRIRVFEPKSPKSTVFANVAEAKTDRRMKMGRLGSG